MTCRWNGSDLPSGHHSCLHMPAGPMRRTRAIRDTRPLTRADLIRLGCVFPRASAPLPARPKKEYVAKGAKIGRGAYTFVSDIERAKIIELYADATGMKVHRIASEVRRTATCVRNVLKAAGVYRQDPRYGAVRQRILAAWKAGKSIHEIAKEASTVASYVQTVLVEAGHLQRRKEAA